MSVLANGLPRTRPAPGRLALVPARPNPRGAFESLHVAVGDALAGPIHAVDGVPPRALAEGTPRRLRLFHFNDLHNMLTVPEAGGRQRRVLSRIVHRVARTRSAAPADEVVVLLSGGDDHTGHVLDELLGWTPEELVTDPAYEAYSAAGVDAATLGNHELDRGSAVLREGIDRSAAFPILSANLFGASALVSGRDFFPAALGVAKGLRVALIGLTTPVDTRAHSSIDPGLEVGDPRTALRNVLPALAAIADVVLVMSHCGYGLAENLDGKAGAPRDLFAGDIALARLAASLCQAPVVVVGGHTHTVLNAGGLGPDTLVDGVPIVQAGGHGSHLGELEARLAAAGTRAGWTVSARLHPLDAGAPGVSDDAFEADVVAPLLARVRDRIEEPLARTDDEPGLSSEVTLRTRYTGECALAHFAAEALVARSAEFAAGPVDFAIVNSTAIGAGLPPRATITFRDLYAAFPFADCVQVAEVTGSQLAAVLANNAPRIVRPEELDGPRALDVARYVSRGFLHFSSAVRYAIRLGRNAPEAAVEDARVCGVPLAEQLDRRFRVALTNYLGAGAYGECWNGAPIGAGVPGAIASFDLRALPRRDTGLVFRNEVVAYARAVGRIGSATGARADGRVRVLRDDRC